MPWLYLSLAGVLEIAWAVGMKFSMGFTRPLATSVTVLTMVLSMVFLVLAVRDLPIGTAYAIWTGVGAVGVAILGMYLFHEPVSLARIIFIGLIVVGIIGLKLTTKA